MLKGMLLVAGLAILPSTLFGQPRLSWEQLTHVEFPKLADQTRDTLAYYPLYGESLAALHGKQVKMEGFVIVADAAKGHYILSRHPFAACYFCGGGGVESIVDLEVKERPDGLFTDDYVSLTGTFFLNPENLDFGIYLLRDVVIED